MSKWPWPHRLNRMALDDAFVLAANRLVDRALHGVVGLGRRHDAFVLRAKKTPAWKHGVW